MGKTDLRVAAGLGVMLRTFRIAFARIRMFFQIVKRRRGDLIALLVAGRQGHRSWIQALEVDFAWIPMTSTKLQELRSQNLLVWARFLMPGKMQSFAAVQQALIEHTRVSAAEELAKSIEVETPVILFDGEWTCKGCGQVLATRNVLLVHLATSHGISRSARRRIAGSTCLICMRRFACRSKVMAHLHEAKGTQICVVNTLLSLLLLTDQEEVEANAQQAADEAACTKPAERRDYTTALVEQSCGPLTKFLVPLDCKRSSRYSMFPKYIKCPLSARAVDFDRLRGALLLQEDPDDVPFDILAELW